MEIENGSGALTTDTVNPEVERLLVENSKLKYQITHLKRVCDIVISVSVMLLVFQTKLKEIFCCFPGHTIFFSIITFGALTLLSGTRKGM